MYQVIKEIHFCYGHRLLNYEGKCAHLHGHNARVQIEVSRENLDKLGMVIDFHEIREVMESWIEQTLDHKMILCDHDPLADVLHQQGEPFVAMRENPTAEALAKWIYDEAKDRKLPVSKVTLWETADSCASYSE